MSRAKALMGQNGALALLAGFVAVLLAGFASLSPETPLQPREDFMGFLFNLKTLALFGGITQNPDVAFPLGGDFSVFPILDMLSLAVARVALLFASSVFHASFLYFAGCFFLAAASAFLCWRSLFFSSWLSFCGALLVALSPFMIARAPVHPYFCMIAVMPWLVRFCLLLFYQQRARLGQKPLRLDLRGALLLGVLTGSSGLYPAFFSAFFVFVAALGAVVAGRKSGVCDAGGKAVAKRLFPAFVVLAALGVTFLAWLAPHLWALLLEGGQLPARHILEQAHYGLRLPDLLIPDLPPFSKAYHAFSTAQAAMTAEGNAPAAGVWSVLGLWGGGGVLFLRMSSLHQGARFWRKRRAPMICVGAFLVLAGILFAMPYGLGLIFNMYVSSMVRAQVRVAVFLMIFGTVLGLAFAARQERRKSKAVFYGATFVVLILSLWPQIYALKSYQDRGKALWVATREAYGVVLQAMDDHGLLRIAQLPSYYYPEGPATPNFSNTEHFTAYLLDSNRDRRWSFGAMLGQDLWRKLAALSLGDPARFDAALDCMGYDAVLIEKRAIPRPQQELILRYVDFVEPSQVLIQNERHVLIARKKGRSMACP